MSINSLANAAAARHTQTIPTGKAPRSLGDIAAASGAPPTIAKAAGAPDPETGKDNIETAFNILFGYIPIEVITLYVAVVAAIGKNDVVTNSEWTAFGIFLLATPLVVWLVYGAKLKNLNLPLPMAFSAWPLWEMFAATAAFAAWAFALPQSVFADCGWYSAALSGLVVLIASTVLGLLAPFFQRQLAA